MLMVKNIIEVNPDDVLGTKVEKFMNNSRFFREKAFKKGLSYIILKTIIVPTLKKDHKKFTKHEQKMLSFLANEMHKAGRQTEGHVVRIIVKPYLQQARKKWTEMTAMQKFRTVM